MTYLDLSQMPHEDAKAYVSRRLLKSAELDRLEIKAILPDLERQLLLSSIEPSLAVWLKTTYPDFESTVTGEARRLVCEWCNRFDGSYRDKCAELIINSRHLYI
jgi:hypothetical protein